MIEAGGLNLLCANAEFAAITSAGAAGTAAQEAGMAEPGGLVPQPPLGRAASGQQRAPRVSASASAYLGPKSAEDGGGGGAGGFGFGKISGGGARRGGGGGGGSGGFAAASELGGGWHTTSEEHPLLDRSPGRRVSREQLGAGGASNVAVAHRRKNRISKDIGDTNSGSGVQASDHQGRVATLPTRLPADLRSLFRSLTFADLDALDEGSFIIPPSTLLVLCKAAIGGDLLQPIITPTASSTAALAAAIAAAASLSGGAIGADPSLPPCSLLANARLALSNLLRRPAICEAVAAELRSSAKRSDLEGIKTYASGLSALLLAAPAATLPAVTSLFSEAVRAHARAHHLLGDTQTPPPLEALPAVLDLLASDDPTTLSAASELVAQLCETRLGRASVVSLPAGQLALLVELLAYHLPAVRAAVLRALLMLSDDRATYAVVVRTAAVQGLLDLVECERLADPDAPATASASGGHLQQALQVLVNLLRHDGDDGGLIELLGEHPAVEDLALKQYLVKPESPATVVQAVV